MSEELDHSRIPESLRKEAKRWLRAIRENSADALARLARALQPTPSQPTLRDVQHALARERGFRGWDELKAARAERSDDRNQATLVNWFIANACPDHHVRGATSHVRARATAMRLLEENAQIAGYNLATKIICGNLQEVTRAVLSDPNAARRGIGKAGANQEGPGTSIDWQLDLGEKGWTPLLYLCFTRLSQQSSNENAPAIARLLIANGADPNAFFPAGGSKYTPLCGIIGEGEEGRPPHPRRDELLHLLLEAGANPFDNQVFYNLHAKGDFLWYLKAIHASTIAKGQQSSWAEPTWSMIDMGGYGVGAWFLLNSAIEHDNVELAEWCLEHGADANAVPPTGKYGSKRQGLLESALRSGAPDIAALLAKHGARDSGINLTPAEQLTSAAFALDAAAVAELLATNPNLIASADAMLLAGGRNRSDVSTLLLDAGISPDVENASRERALHRAAYSGALDVAKLLVTRGAEIDAVEVNWGNTPLGNAAYSQNRPLIDFLAPLSTDIWILTYLGKVERIEELLSQAPELAKTVSGSQTLLMWLPPDDEGIAIRLAQILLTHGANPGARDTEVGTAATRASRMGMFKLAHLLNEAVENASRGSMVHYESAATALLEAYNTGTSEAMRRHWALTWHQRNWQAMRTYVQLDLGKRPEHEGANVEITIDDARLLVAREHGFSTWRQLSERISSMPGEAMLNKPVEVYAVDSAVKRTTVRDTREWAEVVDVVRASVDVGIDARGQLTNEHLMSLAALPGLTSLSLAGSYALNDADLMVLRDIPNLRHLDLSSTGISDRALEILGELESLESLSLDWTNISDTQIHHLVRLDKLRLVSLIGTPTGDEALSALAGKEHLTHLRTGQAVTNSGLALLKDFPQFAKWQATPEESRYDAKPNRLTLRGNFTDAGMHHLRELCGLFALDLDDSNLQITGHSLEHLMDLEHLEVLSFDADDEAMSRIAQLPHLRELSCQDTSAGDKGFTALGKSGTIEQFWGRRSHNLRDAGFHALSIMPRLRDLSTSMKNVGDSALAAFPDFPALRALMPMDVPDKGYRHIARCADLEKLTLMYCRDTGDEATEHIVDLQKLRTYFASYNLVTDRTPALLSLLPSLEAVTFDHCAALTNAGAAQLRASNSLRELKISGQQITTEVMTLFPSHIKVTFSL